MGNSEVSMIAVNMSDIASSNQAKVLLETLDWENIGPVEEKQSYRLGNVRMWMFDDHILNEDNIDIRWFQQTGEKVTEVIFPSKHSASSGKPSLTLHPIGVPHLEYGTKPPFGGKAGHAPPPSTRLSSWWKMLQEYVKGTTLEQEFELTLEVTHHGPWLGVPALFIEIGSTESTWSHMSAAKLLASIITDGMALKQGNAIGTWDCEENAGELVLITLGGGHYAPRANKLASLDGIWLGHMLATYSLPFVKSEVEGDIPGGTWKQAIESAVSATRLAFPNGKIICSMDKKAFKGWQRQAIRNYLIDIDIPLLTTKQITEALTN